MTRKRARKTRVLLVGLKPLAEGLVREALKDHTDIELGSPPRRTPALATIVDWAPDVVIVPAPAGRAAAYRAVLRDYPALRVLEMRGPEADVYEVRLLAENPGNEAVAKAIRSAARANQGGAS